MPRKRAFRCPKCDRTFILESSFNKHNFHGIHDPMKPRGGPREGSGGKREGTGGKREGTGGKREGTGGKREGSGAQRGRSGGKRKNSGPTEDLTAEVIFTI